MARQADVSAKTEGAQAKLFKLAHVDAHWETADASLMPTYFQHSSFVGNGVEILEVDSQALGWSEGP